MKIQIPYNKLNPLAQEYSANLMQLALGAIALGVAPVPSADRTTMTYQVDNDKIPLSTADFVFSEGGDITECPLFIEIEATDDDCPFIDGTWEDWKLSNHTFMERAGRIFIGTNAGNNEDMTWSELQAVRNQLVLPHELPAEDINE